MNFTVGIFDQKLSLLVISTSLNDQRCLPIIERSRNDILIKLIVQLILI